MALIWVALVGLVMILFVATAGDMAHLYLAGHQLQNAADAGALAGALNVRTNTTTAHNRAVAVAASNNAYSASVQLAPNLANNAGGDVVIGVWDSGTNAFTPTLTSPNAVQVTARRTTGSPGGPMPLIFAQAVGINNTDMTRTATATIGGLIHAGIVLLRPHDTAIQLVGSGSPPQKINVTGAGAIQVNSDSTTAITRNGSQAYITADALYVTGNDSALVGSNIFPSGHLGINAPPVPDPLAWLPVPPKGPTQSSPVPSNLQPGYYPGNFPSNQEVKLNSGIYYIEGGIDTNQDIDASAGVMIYLATGSINMGGTSTLKIKPMTTGTYAGIAFFQARGNTAPALIRGDNSTDNSGTFYFPSAELSVQGNPTATASQLVAYSLVVQGSSELTIDYDGRNPVLGHQVWLVK
jgi:Flp pilus assembly protein TadG